jgi:hypothetical protein
LLIRTLIRGPKSTIHVDDRQAYAFHVAVATLLRDLIAAPLRHFVGGRHDVFRASIGFLRRRGTLDVQMMYRLPIPNP